VHPKPHEISVCEIHDLVTNGTSSGVFLQGRDIPSKPHQQTKHSLYECYTIKGIKVFEAFLE
jgi:hypothetical protein